jgi:RNA polymerase sigma-70 factor, ECF subfamily
VRDSRGQFELVYQDCYDAVRRYAARRVAPEAVQDVVSDTFLTAWRRYGELRGEPLPWLLGIARRTAANHRRGGARRDALRERLSSERPACTHPGVGDGDQRVAAALATLTERDREALTLVAWDGLEHREAAVVMGCSTGAFTVRVHRARRKLERALSGEEHSSVDVTREVVAQQAVAQEAGSMP